MESENLKPHISASQLGMMEKCPEQWRRRYVLGQVKPPGISLCVGRAVHKSGEKDLCHKCLNDGQLLPEEEVKEIARDELENTVKTDGLLLSPEEMGIGKKKTIGAAKDLSVSLAALHHQKLAPAINPIDSDHVEKEFLLELTGFDYNIKGIIDVVELGTIRDLKNIGKKPNQADVDRSDQYTVYDLWHWAKYGIHAKIYQDSIVKTKTPYVDIKETHRGPEDYRVLSRKLENFSRIAESGIFGHASTMGWWCSPKWCGYYDSCKYTRNPKTVTVGKDLK